MTYCILSSTRTANGPQQPAIPLVHLLHGAHGPSETELRRLRPREFQRSAQVQVGTIGRSRVGENELSILEANRSMASRNSASDICPMFMLPAAPIMHVPQEMEFRILKLND